MSGAFKPFAEWHDDDGAVLWTTLPVREPPYCGSPLDSEWPYDACGSLYWLPLPHPFLSDEPDPRIADLEAALAEAVAWDEESFIDVGYGDNVRQEYRCSFCGCGPHDAHDEGCPMPKLRALLPAAPEPAQDVDHAPSVSQAVDLLGDEREPMPEFNGIDEFKDRRDYEAPDDAQGPQGGWR